MRPSVEKSLLLALGLAVGASSLDGVRGRGPMAQPAVERLRAAIATEPHAAARPRLVLLPPVPRGAPALEGVAPAIRAAAAAAAAAPTAEARRDEFLRRARRLVEAGPPAGSPAR
jgi:hypothetical protein